MTVAFFGHRHIERRDVEETLRRAITALIENERADCFYVGNQGALSVSQKAPKATVIRCFWRFEALRIFSDSWGQGASCKKSSRRIYLRISHVSEGGIPK